MTSCIPWHFPMTRFMQAFGILAVFAGLVAPAVASDDILDGTDVGQIDLSTTTVLVANRRIEIGTVIKEPKKFFEVKEVMACDAPMKSLLDLESLSYQKIAREVPQGSIIQAEDLVDYETSWIKELFQAVPPGYVPFPIFHRTFGNWQTNVRIDVVQVKEDEEGKPLGQVVLPKVLLVAEWDFKMRGKLWDVHVVAIRPGQILTAILASLRGYFEIKMPRYGYEEEAA